MESSDHALCTLRVAGQKDMFLVESWQGSEAVSRPYRFQITLACPHPGPDPDDLLGARATLAVWVDDQARPWHGVLTRVSLLDPDDQYSRYEVVLEPRLALLREYRRSDVFLDKHLGALIRELLGEIGLQEKNDDQPGEYDFAILVPSGELEATRQSFICQFEETTLDFLSRRLERDGVYYWFEQGEHSERVVFANAMQQQPGDEVELTWRPVSTIDPERDKAPVVSLQYTVDNTERKVELRNFAGSRADLDLTVSAEVPLSVVADAYLRAGDEGQNESEPASVGEYALYGEHYSSVADGQRLAALRAEALAAEMRRCRGRSRAPALRAGRFAHLRGHPHEAMNRRYYVISVEHAGNQPLPGRAEVSGYRNDYTNEFVAQPADVQYRPPLATRRPRIVGLLSAIIDAEGEGKYAELNEHGCYKVVFPFAKTRRPPASNSAWVRMATPYAGSHHGMHLPLLKGTEVLVSFLSGDPDRPVIVAAVPNSENPNRLDSATATKPGLRTAGGNALAFEDREGKESVLIGSPAASSHISVGTLADAPRNQGIAMRSTEHMHLLSSSFQQEVPGIYKMQIFGAGAGEIAPQPSAAGSGPDRDGAGQSRSPGATDAPAATSAGSASQTLLKTDPSPGQQEETSPWWNVKDWKASAKHEGGGAVLTTFAGSSTEIKLGNANSISLALKTDVDIGYSFAFKAAGSLTINATDRLDYSFTKWEKATPAKEETIATMTGLYESLTIHAGNWSNAAGNYTMRAASYSIDAMLSINLGCEPSSLSLSPDSGSLVAPQALLKGTLQTIVGTGLSSTALRGNQINVGNIETTRISLRSTALQIDLLASGQMSADGPLSLQGGLVRIG